MKVPLIGMLALAFIVGAGSGPAAVWFRRWPVRSGRQRSPGEADLLAFARLLAIGVAGGLNLASALELAGKSSHPRLHHEVLGLLRAARTSGLAAALLTVDGAVAPVAALLARTQVTGAPLAPSLDSFIERIENEIHVRSLERIRTLPVRMVVPLTLLLLPGFVLVVVAPGVLEVLGDLGRGVFE